MTEYELESIIELFPCQQQIIRIDDPDDFGVSYICEEQQVYFYATVYLSKQNITQACVSQCPKARRDFYENL